MDNIIGFIGSGNMGYAMMSGLVKSGMKDSIVFTDKNLDKRLLVVEDLDVRPYNTNKEIAEVAKYIVLAVKPQFIKEAIDDIKEVVTDKNIIISIAPVAIKSLKDLFGKQMRIVRVMPNTPALVGEGMSAISFSDDTYEAEEKNLVTSIFSSFGEYEIMEEKYMSAVTAVSGSSPAYVFMFIEAMADAAVKYGMPRKTAYKFAAQAVLGSAKMVLETQEHPGVLKDNVCSPGGTTIEAVSILEKKGFRSAVIEAMDACYNKTNLLSNK